MKTVKINDIYSVTVKHAGEQVFLDIVCVAKLEQGPYSRSMGVALEPGKAKQLIAMLKKGKI